MPRKKGWTLDDLKKLPKTRGEAIANNKKFYFNGNLCKHNHLAPRRFDGKCLDCLRIRDRNRQRGYSAKRRGSDEWKDGRTENQIDLDALVASGLPSSRAEAIKSGEKYYYTGEHCKNGHLSPRSVRGKCIQCHRDYQKANAEKKRQAYKEKVDREAALKGHDFSAPSGTNHAFYTHGKARSLEQLLYNSARGRARKKGIEFTISVSDISIPSHCPILGIEISKTWGDVDMNNEARFNQPSLDRLDPRKGYLPGNVIVISYRANMVKGDGLPSEHRAIAKYIHKHQ